MSGIRLSPEIDGRIFVVGVPRSGTTLVQSLLAAHSATTSFTESHFFDRHFTHLPLLGGPILTRDPEPRVREFLAENQEEPPAVAAGLAARPLGVRPLLPFQTRAVALHLLKVLDELTLRRGRSCWIEKTPRHLRYLPFLERVAGSEARLCFVHVIREGLEVVASLHQASQSWERPYDPADCVRRWNADVGFSLGRSGSATDHFVFYEELTARPEATLQRLLVALGLGWEPEILERQAATADRLVTRQEEAWKADLGRGIRPSATSERTLTAEQRERMSRSLRQGLYEELRQRSRQSSPDAGGAG